MSFTITHRQLYRLLMEKSSEPWKNRYEHADDFIKRAFPQDMLESDWRTVKADCRKKYAAVKKRWDDSHRIEANLFQKYLSWLDTPVTFATPDKQIARPRDTSK